MANRELEGRLWAGEVQRGKIHHCGCAPQVVLESQLQLDQGLIQFPAIVFYFRGKTRVGGGINVNIFLLILSDKCSNHGNRRSSISGVVCLVNTFSGFPFLLVCSRMFVLSPGTINYHTDTTQGQISRLGVQQSHPMWK